MPIKLKKPAPIVSDMLTVDEAATVLGVSRRYLDKDRYEARANGTPPKVPFSVLGHRTIRYSRADLLAFLEAKRIA